MDQDGTWHGGGPQSKRLSVSWGPSPSLKRGRSPSPIFGPFLLWLNGWMHQDATWYGGKTQPRELCVRCGPSPLPKRGQSPQFLAHVYCGQTAAWIKMPLGTEVGLCLRDIVLDGYLTPNFRPMSVVAKRLDGLRCHLVWKIGLGPGDFVFDEEPANPRKKGTSTPTQFLAHVYCGHGRPSQLLLSSCTNGLPIINRLLLLICDNVDIWSIKITCYLSPESLFWNR